MKKTFFVGHGQGKSMEPFVNEGDKLFVEKVKLADLKIGDIIVFYRNKDLIGHRVIKKKNGQIMTKGDNCPYLDRPLINNEILGKVVKIEGKYGKINLATKLFRFLSLYFLFYSLSTYYFPFIIRKILMKSLRGRKILTRILASDYKFFRNNPQAQERKNQYFYIF